MCPASGARLLTIVKGMGVLSHVADVIHLRKTQHAVATQRNTLLADHSSVNLVLMDGYAKPTLITLFRHIN